VLHQAGVSHGGRAVALAIVERVVACTACAEHEPTVGEPLFRLAPKTSPPVA
jgi:hypothetical protein